MKKCTTSGIQIKITSHTKKQENIVHNQEKKSTSKHDLEIKQMMELAKNYLTKTNIYKYYK